jgi:hypothetical protein
MIFKTAEQSRGRLIGTEFYFGEKIDMKEHNFSDHQTDYEHKWNTNLP